MTGLIDAINEIVQFGLQPRLAVPNRDKRLEKALVKIYSCYFDIDSEVDGTDYPAFDKQIPPDIRQNIESNFPDFGLYKTVTDINDFTSMAIDGTGDAIDDLTDIVLDLLEIKWRMENNNLHDGLWYFQFIFKHHTQQHLLDLLNYMKQKNG